MTWKKVIRVISHELNNSLAPVASLAHSGAELVRRGKHERLEEVFGTIGFPGFSAYSASKFGLRGFAEALRRELADSGIRVLHLAPRATRTAINSDAVVAMNAALGAAMDAPQQVAAQIVQALRDEAPERALGWPEKFFARLNRLLPGLVDRALRKQLPTVKRFAAAQGEGGRG